MTGLFMVMLPLAMLAAVATLACGLISMVRGDELNRKYGNRLMQLRVLMQGIALLLLLAMMIF